MSKALLAAVVLAGGFTGCRGDGPGSLSPGEDTSPVGIPVQPPNAEIQVGQRQEFRMLAAGSWRWSVSDTSIATIHPDSGHATGKAVGAVSVISTDRANTSRRGVAVLTVRWAP